MAASTRRGAWRDAREQAGHWKPFAFLLHMCMFALCMISSYKYILRLDSAASEWGRLRPCLVAVINLVAKERHLKILGE